MAMADVGDGRGGVAGDEMVMINQGRDGLSVLSGCD